MLKIEHKHRRINSILRIFIQEEVHKSTSWLLNIGKLFKNKTHRVYVS